MNVGKFGLIHVKHLSIWDTELLDIRRLEYLNRAEKEGLPSNEEKLKYLKRDDLWSDEKEGQIKNLTSFVDRASETRSKLILKSEINRMTKEIDKSSKERDILIQEKSQLMGLTSELYADKKVNDYYVFLTLHKDVDLKEEFFSEEEFDELSDAELSLIINGYNNIASMFADINVKRIAVSGFFLNNFYLCKDNPFTFFGKPVTELTYHQVDLFSFGRYFKHILSELKSPPSEEDLDEPDRIIGQHTIQENKEKMGADKVESGSASTYVGATQEDLEALGMGKDEAAMDPDVVDLNEEIRKKGGTLSMEDMIKIHGV